LIAEKTLTKISIQESTLIQIPTNLVQEGENEILIKVSCYLMCRINHIPYITTIENNISYFFIVNLIFTGILVGSGSVLFLLYLLFIIKNIFRKEAIFFILQLIPGFIVVLINLPIQFNLFWEKNIIIQFKILGISWTLLVLFHLLFLHSIYKVGNLFIEFLLYFIHFLCIVFIILVHEFQKFLVVGNTIILILISLAIYNLYLHLKEIKKKNPVAYYFFPFGIILNFSACHDGIFYLSLFQFKIFRFLYYTFEFPIFSYTSLTIFLGAGFLLFYHVFEMNLQLNQINQFLKTELKNKTNELKENFEKLSNTIEIHLFNNQIRNKSLKNKIYFSENTKEKIKEAILYLNENFLFEISREGLASKFNLHPDFFSKAFKHFTGKKINQYINELRIKHAISLMQDTSKNILEISLESGFENLRTFNRVFKEITGKTPKEYKKFLHSRK
jgi:AraC-like DNA-binding protein